MSGTERQERSVRLNVPVLTRVEGEGALHLVIEKGVIQHARLAIFEPPRLFEKFLEGRSYTELPDLVARVCGICPVAYQLSAADAVESLFGVDPGPWVRDMRTLMYCGEWIESHCLHIHLLAAPDFLGYPDALSMAKDHPELLRRGMQLQGLGNQIIRLLGGRSVHPVGVRIGGFHHAPAPGEVKNLLQQLREALPNARALLKWALSLELPERNQNFVSMACTAPDHYPMLGEQLATSDGQRWAKSAFEQHVSEHQEPDSTALFSLLDGHPYLVGPLARYNLAGEYLSESTRALLKQAGMDGVSSNPFHSLAIRAAEVNHAMERAVELLEAYRLPPQPWTPVEPRAGVGFGCTEAPRGSLWHRFEFDDQGLIRQARLVPPTSQNQARIEQDLKQSLEAFGLDHDDQALRLHCEQVIRNYDPCISCATHFLRLTTERL